VAEQKDNKKPFGRPTKYTPEYGEEICCYIASHFMGIEKLSELYPHLPCEKTISNWIRKHPDFLRSYLQAKEVQAHLMMEKAIDIANRDLYEDDSLLKINRDKLKIDTIKFSTVKLNPTHYGDKKEQKLNIDISESKVRDASSSYDH
jgi:hypothetical protein